VPSTNRPAPAWVALRIARPVGDLELSAAFYRETLGLPRRGGFRGHEGYAGEFVALPGGVELELTTGPAGRGDRTEEPLVLYLRTLDEVQAAADALEAAGVPAVPAANPYWNRWGRTFLDPDGRAVAVAAVDRPAADVRIEPFEGDREELRELFELAEDSRSHLDSYLFAGRVLVAIAGAQRIGHLQLVESPGRAEITNMAVRPAWQGRGVGARLVHAAVDLVARGGSAPALLVATAAADTGNLRFYQRQGFRLRSVERDAFTPATGYPPGLSIDGVELRDRVWLDRPVSSPAR
jgi:ribosomal protein S18 acetylase RimI-like enzyme